MISSWNENNTIFDDMKGYLEGGRSDFLFGVEMERKNADFIIDGSLPLDKIVECISEKVMALKNC